MYKYVFLLHVNNDQTLVNSLHGLHV